MKQSLMVFVASLCMISIHAMEQDNKEVVGDVNKKVKKVISKFPRIKRKLVVVCEYCKKAQWAPIVESKVIHYYNCKVCERVIVFQVPETGGIQSIDS